MSELDRLRRDLLAGDVELREALEAAISIGLEDHDSAWIDGQNKVRCYGCDVEVGPGGIGWHQIEAAADAVLKITEPQEATAP